MKEILTADFADFADFADQHTVTHPCHPRHPRSKSCDWKDDCILKCAAQRSRIALPREKTKDVGLRGRKIFSENKTISDC